jgi:hypothetical protein
MLQRSMHRSKYIEYALLAAIEWTAIATGVAAAMYRTKECRLHCTPGWMVGCKSYCQKQPGLFPQQGFNAGRWLTMEVGQWFRIRMV